MKNQEKKELYKLSYDEKEKLRIIFGYYKALNKRDFDTKEEYFIEIENTKKDLVKEHEKFVAYIVETYKCKAPEDAMWYLPEYIYSENQLLFIEDAENQGHKIIYNYSGRGMYSDCCPAIFCDNHNDLKTKANTKIDSMGLGIVIYAQN